MDLYLKKKHGLVSEMHQLEVNMATNDRVIALGSRALLAVVSLPGASLGGAAAVPGNNTSVSEGRSTLGVVAAATRTKVAEQKIKTNTKLKTTGRLAPGTTNTLNPQPLPPGKAFKLYPGAQSPKPRF